MLKLAWKNVWRNKHRSLITMSSIFSAVMLAVLTTSLQDGVFDNLVKNVVSFHSGYLQVHKNGYWKEQILDNGMRISPAVEDSILRSPGIRDLTPRLESFVLASSEEVTKGCLVTGIVPEKENLITSLEKNLVEGAFLESGDRALLIAAGLAEQLQLGVGDSLVLIGQGYHGSMAVGYYRIKGILKFGSPQLNDQTVFLPLALAQDFFDADSILTSYVLSIDAPNKVSEIAARLGAGISADYEVMTWEEIVPEIAQHIKTDKGSMFIIIGVLYLLIVFGIFSTQLMMMVERKFETAMLISIGMAKARIIRSLLMEAVMTVMVGCLIGITISIPLVHYLNKHPIRFSGEMARAYEQFGFEPIFPASTEAVHFWSQGLIVLIIGLFISLYPAIHVLRLDTTKAIRRG